MATPFDGAGGLLGIDPEEMRKVMAQIAAMGQQFAPTEGERSAANNQALVALGLSLLGTRKGEEWDRLGAGGFNALNARGASLEGASKAKRAQMADGLSAMELMGKLRAQQQSVADQRNLGGIFGSGGAAGGAPAGALPEGAAGPPAAAPALPPAVAQYRQAAAYYASRGNVDAAKKYAEIADKMEEEYSTTPQVVRGADGKLQLAQFSKRGNTKVTEGMTPAEKLQFVNAGGAIIPSDPYTGAQAGGAIPVTMDAAQIASNEVARGNLDVNRKQLGISGGNLALARQRFDMEKSAPQFDASTGQFVYKPSADKPTGSAVKPEGYTPKPPEHTRRELDSIDAQLGIVAGAKKATVETPKAFGFWRGAATEGGSTTESIAGRYDTPEERTTRSYVFNVVSSVINERAGAAQSVQELARLRSFLPADKDSAKQVEDKLTAFENYLNDKRKAYAGAGKAPAAADGWSARKLP